MRVRGAAAYLLPGLGDMVWIAALVSVVGLGPRMMNIDGDLGRHLTIGRYILDSGQVPTHDLFSHTMLGQTLTPHEWLSQVIFALADRWMGLSGVVLVCALVIALTFWLVYRRALVKSRMVLLAVGVTVLAMAASSLHWLTRPHVFTFLMLALWIDCLEQLRCGYARAWWRLPLIMLVWVNLHGAFIAGFVTWAIYGFGMLWDYAWNRSSGALPVRAYLLGGAVALLVTLINPAGLEIWGTSVGYIGNRYLVNHTAEYLPPDFHDPSTWPFLLMVAITFVILGLQTQRVAATQVFVSGAWLVMALYSVRNVPLFVIAAAPGLAAVLSQWLADSQYRLGILRRWAALEGRLFATERCLKGFLWPGLATLLVALALWSGAALDYRQAGNRFDPEVFPVQAVDWMRTHPQQGAGFNYFPWGGYLLYRLWPDQKVFIDGQTDFYGEALTREYEQVLVLAPGWEDVLKKYDVRWVLMPPDEPSTQALMSRDDWQIVYQDKTAVLLVLVGP